jgi:hypothetical protein
VLSLEDACSCYSALRINAFSDARQGQVCLCRLAAVNLTRVQLGFNVNVRRVLNDFGVIRWYQYLVSESGRCAHLPACKGGEGGGGP